MTDIIRLLPDVVANQIAAGEVIQRPASAVKELMENSLDAGATQINLIIKDAGKTLIQVVDNGVGMSETDARMAFERHATSKIQKAEDLFAIKTMGFRGEAMASVGAVAQVELKTRKHESETGTHLIIEGSKFLSQEPCATQPGTTIMVKNLFYNIPARRNFLKSNASETRHIVEEFQRLAIARPEIGFAMFHDGFEVYRLHPGNLKQRIMGIYGNNYNERMVPVQEATTILNLGGFVLKPEYARKTRGEQYFFVNNRFIKNGYLNHAVTDAFESLLPNGTFPSYFIMIDIDPAKIDINIHPTKTEIKFEDEKSVYAIIRAAVKRSLGKFSITPSLDFEQETAFNIPVHMYQSTPKTPGIKINPGYNPFREQPVEKTGQAEYRWGQISRPVEHDTLLSGVLPLPEEPIQEEICQVLCQYDRQFIVALYQNAFVFIDQQAAHERVLFEKNKKLLEQTPAAIQQELFPQTLTFSPDDFLIIKEILSDIGKLGFDLREFGSNTIVLNGVPAGVEKGKEKEVIDHILESFKNSNHQFRNNQRENLLISVSRNLAIKSGQELSIREMQHLAEQLFKCDQPGLDASGRPTFVSLDSQEINKKFQQRTR